MYNIKHSKNKQNGKYKNLVLIIFPKKIKIIDFDINLKNKKDQYYF